MPSRNHASTPHPSSSLLTNGPINWYLHSTVLPMSSSTKSGGSSHRTLSTRKRSYGEEDVLNFFYKPHTISAMIVGGIIMIYFAFSRDEGASTQDNVKTYVPKRGEVGGDRGVDGREVVERREVIEASDILLCSFI